MKIADSCKNNEVFQHFGHTPEFAVFTVEENKVVSKRILSCGGTGHGALAGLLKEGRVDLLICGGIGGGAQMALAEAGIRLIGGAAGKVDEVVAAYLKGELSVNPDFRCHHHDGDAGHKCGEHHCGNRHWRRYHFREKMADYFSLQYGKFGKTVYITQFPFSDLLKQI